MLVADLARLTPQSTLADLPNVDVTVSAATPGQQVAGIFDEHPDLPGVLVAGHDGSIDLLPRSQFFQQMSRPFSLALYQKRPIQVLLHALPVRSLELSAECGIAE